MKDVFTRAMTTRVWACSHIKDYPILTFKNMGFLLVGGRAGGGAGRGWRAHSAVGV